MTVIGTPNPALFSTSCNLTRDELIAMAYEDIKVLAKGEVLSAELLATGIKKLCLVIREHDLAGKHLWAITPAPSNLTLVANTFIYTEANGLPTTILDLVSVSYRDPAGTDRPVKILTTEQYEGMANKLDQGEPQWVYLTEEKDNAEKILYVGPMLPTVNTQSTVTGYRCIRSHTADSTTEPGVGANDLLFWEVDATATGTWATGTSYTAPQLLRIWFKRPLYDFVSASDNPDMPAGWTRWLRRELALDLAPGHNRTVEEINLMRSLRNESHEKIFRSTQPNTTEIHDKVTYF